MQASLCDTPLRKKIHGCLLGAAIGDAFGLRVELMHYRDIEAQYGRVTDFEPLAPRRESSQPPLEMFNPFRPGWKNPGPVDFTPLGRWSDEEGVYTDDMRYRLLVCNAILRKRRPINSVDLANEWFHYRLMAEGADDHETTLSWDGPERDWARMMASLPGLAHMAQAQRPTIAGWDGPLGLMYAGDPERAAAIGYSMAVAVAAAFTEDATIDHVIAKVLEHAAPLGQQAPVFVGRMNRLLEIAAGCKDVFDLREPFYREFLVTFPPWEAVFNLEMVPCALALCLIARDDFEQAVVGATNMGRDTDTIAAITGELMGTLVGADALPQPWVERVVRLNPKPDLAEVADGLAEIVVERARRQHAKAHAVLSLAEIDPQAECGGDQR